MGIDVYLEIELPKDLEENEYKKCFRRTNDYNIAKPSDEYFNLFIKLQLKNDIKIWNKYHIGEKPSLKSEMEFYSNFVFDVSDDGCCLSHCFRQNGGKTILNARVFSMLLPNIEVALIESFDGSDCEYKTIYKGGKKISTFKKHVEYEINPNDPDFDEKFKNMTERHKPVKNEYLVNGKFITSKGRVVLEIIKLFCTNNKCDFKELIEYFPKELVKDDKNSVIALDTSIDNKRKGKYFMDSPIILSSGETIYVNNKWTKEKFRYFEDKENCKIYSEFWYWY